jgi:hypothetical protein
MAQYTINAQYQRGFMGSLMIAIMCLMTVFMTFRIGAFMSAQENFIASLRHEADARTYARTCMHNFIIQFTYFYPIVTPSSLYDSSLCSVRFFPVSTQRWHLTTFATSTLVVVKEEVEVERQGLHWAVYEVFRKN